MAITYEQLKLSNGQWYGQWGEQVEDLSFSPNGNYLAVCGYPAFYIYDAHTLDTVQNSNDTSVYLETLLLGERVFHILSCDFSSDSSLLMIGTKDYGSFLFYVPPTITNAQNDVLRDISWELNIGSSMKGVHQVCFSKLDNSFIVIINHNDGFAIYKIGSDYTDITSNLSVSQANNYKFQFSRFGNYLLVTQNNNTKIFSYTVDGTFEQIGSFFDEGTAQTFSGDCSQILSVNVVAGSYSEENKTLIGKVNYYDIWGGLNSTKQFIIPETPNSNITEGKILDIACSPRSSDVNICVNFGKYLGESYNRIYNQENWEILNREPPYNIYGDYFSAAKSAFSYDSTFLVTVSRWNIDYVTPYKRSELAAAKSISGVYVITENGLKQITNIAVRNANGQIKNISEIKVLT